MSPRPSRAVVPDPSRTAGRALHGWLGRKAAVLAGVAFVVAVALLAGALALGRGNAAHGSGSEEGLIAELVWMASWLGFGVVGVLLTRRLAHNPIGWILLGIPISIYASAFLAEYAVRGLVVHPGSLPLALVAGWASQWTFIPGVGLVFALVVVFPRGRIETRVMRAVCRAVLVLLGCFAVLLAVEPTPVRGDLEVMNPLAVTGFGDALVVATQVVGHGLAALGVVALGDLLLRWRRAGGIERLQFRWFAVAVAGFSTMFVVSMVVSDILGVDWGWDPVVLGFFAGMNGVAAAIGVAVNRYRLYEIDRLASRTATYTLVLGVLVALYAATVVALQALLAPVASGSDLAVAGSTLIVAALFGPVLRRVRSAVDRRFDRARYDAHRTVEVFARRLRDEVDLDALTDDLRDAVGTALRPRQISVWLGPGGGP